MFGAYTFITTHHYCRSSLFFSSHSRSYYLFRTTRKVSSKTWLVIIWNTLLCFLFIYFPCIVSYILCPFIHSFTVQPFFSLFLLSLFLPSFYFCLLFRLPPLWAGLGGVLWYAMCFDACAVDSSMLNILSSHALILTLCISLYLLFTYDKRDLSYLVKPIILNKSFIMTINWYLLLNCIFC